MKTGEKNKPVKQKQDIEDMPLGASYMGASVQQSHIGLNGNVFVFPFGHATETVVKAIGTKPKLVEIENKFYFDEDKHLSMDASEQGPGEEYPIIKVTSTKLAFMLLAALVAANPKPPKAASKKEREKFLERENLCTQVHLPLNKCCEQLGFKMAGGNGKKKAQRTIVQALDQLKSLNYHEDSEVNGESYWMHMSIISSHRRIGDYIYVNFDANAAATYITSPMSKFPQKILQIPSRDRIAYIIACKMYYHGTMANNIKNNTANVLRVKSLLAELNDKIPSVDHVRGKKNSWRDRIKNRLETNLNLLEKLHLIKTWKYCGPRGSSLEAGEEEFPTYEEWKEARIYFELNI